MTLRRWNRKPRCPGHARAFPEASSRRGWIAIYIILAWDAPGDPLVALAHEQVHQLTADTNHPLWFREGLAEYLSRWDFREGQAYLGGTVPSFLGSLEEEDSIPLSRLVDSSNEQELVSHPAYYAQCWLLVHWLATSAGQGELPDPKELARRMNSMGAAGVDEQLRAHARALPAASPIAVSLPASPAVSLRCLEEWESAFWRADALREGNQTVQAQARLTKLEKAFPAQPEPSAALGALEMDARNYRKAEAAFARAVSKGPVEPRTHYRYSLMLMRPVEDPKSTSSRTRLAVEHARRARQEGGDEPLYAFTETQALVLEGRWSQAAQILSDLSRDPSWRERAEQEFLVLVRRRQQLLGAVPPPILSARIETFRLPVPAKRPESVPKPAAPPPLRGDEQAWPPPGTIVIYGWLTSVDCQGTEKIVTIQTPRWQVRLREPASRRATLHSPPKKWRNLPCEARGFWEVNVAYRPTRENRDGRGELVAILF